MTTTIWQQTCRAFALGCGLILGALSVSPAPAQPAETTPASAPAATEPLIVRSGDTAHRFNVELAATPQQRVRGLMYRESMPDDHGMLFDFGDEAIRTMWMKNTLIPLDMLFIDGGGVIRDIAAMTTPHSLEEIASSVPVRFVLELNGGAAAARDIHPGDRILHPILLRAR